MKFHRQFITRKYSRLFGEKKIQKRAGRPPVPLDIRTLVIEIKSRNPSFGCPQIGSIVKDRTGTSIDNETVRRILIKEIDEVWSVPHTPTSHPYCERLIGTVRREFVDRILFWNEFDLAKKLASYQRYFNDARVHAGIDGERPGLRYSGRESKQGTPSSLGWVSYCRGLFTVPEVA
jgi:hypothetical protein